MALNNTRKFQFAPTNLSPIQLEKVPDIQAELHILEKELNKAINTDWGYSWSAVLTVFSTAAGSGGLVIFAWIIQKQLRNRIPTFSPGGFTAYLKLPNMPTETIELTTITSS